ncbi:MAG TPA: hypothetical protein VMS17_26050 [Gemmataceae bacterium]|nr:hypothetical protein [Gemmataceae bacterium]
MTEPTNIVPDPLDELLHRPDADDAEVLRRRLLERTTRSLRRRRRLRVVGWAAALAACYLAGIGTMFWFAPRRVELVEVQKAPTPAPAPQPQPQSAPTAGPTSAVALEWKAFDADKPRPDLYRQAGDQYLRDDDPASAVRCYGQALKDASDKDLEISPDDDYLLMMVKEARLKETNDAKKHG